MKNVSTSDVLKIISAYENLRFCGELKHMKELYGNHIGGYLEEKHRKHIDFNSFLNILDHHHELHYSKMILERAKKL